MRDSRLHINGRDLMAMWEVLIEAAALDCRADGIRRVVGMIEHPDKSVSFATMPEAEARTNSRFLPGWLVTPGGDVVDLPMGLLH